MNNDGIDKNKNMYTFLTNISNSSTINKFIHNLV